MTEKEYKLTCEVEKLKAKLQEKNNKIKDLEAQKNIQEQIEYTKQLNRGLIENKQDPILQNLIRKFKSRK